MKYFTIGVIALSASLCVARPVTDTIDIGLQSIQWTEESGDNAFIPENIDLEGSALGIAVQYYNQKYQLKTNLEIQTGLTTIEWHLDKFYPEMPALHAQDVSTQGLKVQSQRTVNLSIPTHSSPIQIELGSGLGYWQQSINGASKVFDATDIPLYNRKQAIVYLPVSLEIKKAEGNIQPFANLTYAYWLQGKDHLDLSGLDLEYKVLDQPNGFGATGAIGIQYHYHGHQASFSLSNQTWLIDFSNVAPVRDLTDNSVWPYRSGKKLIESSVIQASYSIAL